MQLKNFSQAAQKVLIQCRAIAQKNHNLLVEPEHLALALLMTAELKELLEKKKLSHKELESALLLLIANFPVGVEEDPHFSSRLIQALTAAEALSMGKGHENIFVSDLFFSLLENRDKYGSLGGVLEKYFFDERSNQIKQANSSSQEQQNHVLFPQNDNINYLVKNGQLDPVFGRNNEIERIIQILSRKTRNSPILIGEPGVGRTSIIYGLVKRMVEQKVPLHLISKEIVTLDMASLLSGTTLRGQFEERVRKLIDDITLEKGRYILFVRDLSSLIGAGGEGASDAANLFKPALARGLIQLIGLVTPDAYKKRIEADPSFERYFEPLWIGPPSPLECEEILFGLKGKYEQFHGVFINDDAIKASIELGARHVAGGVLPELALSLLDEACSRHRVLIDEKPLSLVLLQEKMIAMEMELASYEGAQREKKEAALKKQTELFKKKSEVYERELSLVESMRAIRNELLELSSTIKKEMQKGDIKKASTIAHKNLKVLEAQFSARQKELGLLKKNERFIDPFVKREDIAFVISQRTGIPAQKMLQSEREKLLTMESLLSAHVIGQKQAIVAVANAIRRARVGLKDEKRPIGSFLFLGPTGVGKTELARTLTNFLFDDERAMVRFDMSEFMERHSVARLIGAPPGYSGSEEGGQLTEKIRRKPYSVVLFDEIEKAHADVLNVLLQVLDEGRLTDSLGHLVTFSNTVIIMTSNVGSDLLLSEKNLKKDVLKEKVMERLLAYLRPELINRIDEIVLFEPIEREGIKEIADLMLHDLSMRLHQQGFTLLVDQEVKDLLVQEGFSREFGARPLKRTIQRLLENPLAMALVKDGFQKGVAIKAGLLHGEIVFSQSA